MKDQRKTPPAFEKGALNLSCLQESQGTLHLLFEGKITESAEDEARVRSVWSCVDRALEAFSKFTKGANDDRYLATELQGFANRTLRPGIDDAFLKSIFQLKVAVLGGDENSLTHGEILKLRANLRAFGEAIVPLAPHVGELMTAGRKLFAKNSKAIPAFRGFLLSLSSIFATSVNPLRWDVVAEFAKNLEKFLQADQPTGLGMVYEQKDLIRYGKVLLIGGSDTEIEQDRWERIAQGLNAMFSARVVSKDLTGFIDTVEIRILSTPEEQGRAMDGMAASLRALLREKNLSDPESIRKTADSFIMARMGLEVLLPGFGSEVSLDLLFRDPDLRKSLNRLAKRSLEGEPFPDPRRNPKKAADALAEVREHLRITDRVLTRELKRKPDFSIKRIIALASEHREFFADPAIPLGVEKGAMMFALVRSAVTGKDSDRMELTELDTILLKVEQGLRLIPTGTVPPAILARKVVEVLKTPPAVTQLSRAMILKVIPYLPPEVPKEAFRSLIDAGFELKAGLWNTGREALLLTDIENALAVFGAKDALEKDPAGTIEKFDRLWSTGSFQSGIGLSTVANLARGNLPKEEPWSRLALLSKGVDGIRAVRKFLLGTDGDFLSLKEIVLLIREGQALQALSSRPKELLARLLKGPGSLSIDSAALISLISLAGEGTGRNTKGLVDLIPEILSLKHQLLGTGPEGIVRKDFEILHALLSIEAKGPEDFPAVLKALDQAGLPPSASFDPAAIVALLEKMRKSVDGFTIEESALRKLRALAEVKTILFGETPPGISLAEIKAALPGGFFKKKVTDITMGRFVLNLFLARNAAKEFTLADLRSKMERMKEPVRLLSGKPFDVDRFVRILTDVMRLKAILFGSRADAILRSEIVLLENLMAVQDGGASDEVKMRRVSDLLRQSIRSPIRISELVPALNRVMAHVDLKEKPPIPLTVDNVQKIKLIMMGGDPDLVKPEELARLLGRVASGGSPETLIEKPEFTLDSRTFLWLESALSLVAESGKEFGLKEGADAVKKYFKDSGVKLKYSMERSLYLIWSHLLEGKKGIINTEGLVLSDRDRITTKHLRILAGMFGAMRVRLEDLERSFDGKKGKKGKSSILAGLKVPSNREVLNLFPPILKDAGAAPEIYFSPEYADRGEFQFRELAYRIVAHEALSFVIPRYSKYSTHQLSTFDFAILLDDLRTLMLNFKMLYRASHPLDAASDQMRTINLFMRNGNGDQALDLNELTEFMTMTYGMGAPFLRFVDHLGDSRCTKIKVEDLDGFEGRCVADHLMEPGFYKESFSGNLPAMVDALSALGQKEQFELAVGTMKLTGMYMFEEKPLGWFRSRTPDDYRFRNLDMDHLQNIFFVHPLVEMLFETMDTSRDGRVQLQEALGFFPKICQTLKIEAKGKVKGTCGSDDQELQALFGYMIVNKKAPEGFISGASYWLNWGRTWKKYLDGTLQFPPLSRAEVFGLLSGLVN